MSTPHCPDDALRIPPTPRPRRLVPWPPAADLPVQLPVAAAAAFGLAWVLTSFAIG